jgi:hypothetical protein
MHLALSGRLPAGWLLRCHGSRLESFTIPDAGRQDAGQCEQDACAPPEGNLEDFAARAGAV